MTTAAPSTALVMIRPAFTDAERLRILRGASSLEKKPTLTTLNGESGPRRRGRASRLAARAGPRTKQEREREVGA
jgi:hypothetical protein